MKQSLQLKIGQQLTMTPQLQQAIRLLQLSTLDLQAEIQEAIESNPMLEVEENQPENTKNDDKPSETPETSSTDDSKDTLDWNDDSIPDDLPVDTQWDDIYQSSLTSSTSKSSSSDFNEIDFSHKNTHDESLQESLTWQLNLIDLVETDRIIAMAIIDSIEPSGFLSAPAQEIYETLIPEVDIEFEEFEAVRYLIMEQLDPIASGCQNLKECLLVQLKQMPVNTPFVNDARLIIDRHMALLGAHDYAQLKRRTKFKEGRLKSAIELIQSLTPRPGDNFDTGDTEYISPDVYVKKCEGRWLVELSSESNVNLRINETYASMIKRADNSNDNAYLKDNLQEAKWFIKSLQSRNETLMKVASKIVEYQKGFLEYGEEAMKPLVLHDIANETGMHESTISRVTTKKYMHTPRGIFELKYFFSSHVSTDAGGECSSTAIRAIIKKFIANENQQKPLSDSKIANLLAEQGIKVARRTVAKYRESMAIPPSNERKRLA